MQVESSIEDTIKYYQQENPDFAALLVYLNKHSSASNGNQLSINEKAQFDFLNLCLHSKLRYNQQKLTLEQIKRALDTYSLDESKLQKECEKLAQTEISNSDAGPSALLLLSQLSSYISLIRTLETCVDTNKPNFHCGFSTQCLLDSVRTRRFLQAIAQRIRKIEVAQPDIEHINVIDAGCGSVPIMGLYAALCSPKVKVIALEFESASAIIAQHLIADLGMEKQIEIIHCDATKYVPQSENVHLAISETMNHGFYTEHMHVIMNNLKTHISDKAYFIPNQVNLSLVFKEQPTKEPFIKHDFKGLYSDASTLSQWVYTPGTEGKVLFDYTPAAEALDKSGYFAIRTDVQLSDSIHLNPGESHITITTSLPDYYDPTANGKATHIQLTYEAGDFKATQKTNLSEGVAPSSTYSQ